MGGARESAEFNELWKKATALFSSLFDELYFDLFEIAEIY